MNTRVKFLFSAPSRFVVVVDLREQDKDAPSFESNALQRRNDMGYSSFLAFVSPACEDQLIIVDDEYIWLSDSNICEDVA